MWCSGSFGMFLIHSTACTTLKYCMVVRFLFVIYFILVLSLTHFQRLKRKTCFSMATQMEHLQPILDSERASRLWRSGDTSHIGHCLWDTVLNGMTRWTLLLTGRSVSTTWDMVRLVLFFSAGSVGFLSCVIAQQWNYKPEKIEDYLSAPETLLRGASCSLRTLISGCCQWDMSGKSRAMKSICDWWYFMIVEIQSFHWITISSSQTIPLPNELS